MGSYAYCSKCECGLSQPTIQQIISPEVYPYECPRCGAVNTHNETLLDAFEILIKQIKELTEQVAAIDHHLWPIDED